MVRVSACVRVRIRVSARIRVRLRLGFSSDIRLRQDPQLRVSYLYSRDHQFYEFHEITVNYI